MVSTRVIDLESQEVVSTSTVTTAALLRVLASVCSLAAALLVATNHQERWGIRVDFTMFQVWVAFVVMNLVCAVYATATAALTRKLVSKSWLHNTDQLVVNLEAAATAGAGAVGAIAMWGNEASGWFAVCRMYRRYCNVSAAALVLSFAAVLFLGFACARSRYPRTLPLV
ncbi:hypothetical protein GUJ93_ZPchr0002g23108 [Zizania palustris]|uniref:CASP-like protein n=1 Tax=Zizania palustris TaxID=103762 RepID=A0A8J5RUU3_ZIZPA|nr:hypothetical protein GUJ93_ZPchr0002g25514 [Zizania palustris]KAG8058528.1 hypothetical protein GUJ93_ZPchr0002g23108 [Zizania palustris]